MEDISGLKTEELERRVTERIKQIERIVNFIVNLTDEVGRVVDYHQGSSNTHVVARVDGFMGFTFLADTGHSMMGGNDFHVWYHPGKKEIDTKQAGPVFSVYYQSSIDEDSKIHVFDSGPEWQDALNKMIDREKEIIAEAKREKQNKEKQLEGLEQDKEKREKMLKRAGELKLIAPNTKRKA